MAVTRRTLRHGRLGLLVVLFAVTGLMFTYGLEHPPVRACTAHIAGAAHSTAVESADMVASAGHPAPGALNACLSMAVLLTLMVLTLARRPSLSAILSPRLGWLLRPPDDRRTRTVPLSELQVLRL